MASEVKEEQNSKPDVSEDENTAADGPQDSSTKDVKDMKSETKEDGGKEESEDEEEEEVGLLDRPVEVTGCRARKKVERLDVSFALPKEKPEFLDGKGKKLGECPRIEMQIQKLKVPDLKPLHKILFNRAGSANEIKKNIRKFSGFPFDKDSTEYIRKKGTVEKLTQAVLKQVCLVLDLERGGTKEDIVTRIMSFLLMPEDSGKKVPAKKPTKEKKKSTGKSVKKSKSAKKAKSSEKIEIVKKDSDGDQKQNMYMNMIMDEDESGEDSMGGTDEESEALLEEPKPKSKAKKTKPKAEKEVKEEKPKSTKRKIEEDSSDESVGEQPETKKANKMPSDEEISKLVTTILEAADLQEITMKKVIKQVSDAYPDFDLTHKKPFIKTTIKSIIKYM